MRAILAICRSTLAAALALGLTAAPLCAAASVSARESAVNGIGHAHGVNSIVVVCSNAAAPSPAKFVSATDQGDDYDSAHLVGAADSMWTRVAEPIGVVNAPNSHSGFLPLHSLIAQRTCLRL